MKKKWLLFTAILWFYSTACWTVTLWADFYYKETPTGLVVLHGVTVLTSLVAAVVNLARYKKENK